MMSGEMTSILREKKDIEKVKDQHRIDKKDRIYPPTLCRFLQKNILKFEERLILRPLYEDRIDKGKSS